MEIESHGIDSGVHAVAEDLGRRGHTVIAVTLPDLEPDEISEIVGEVAVTRRLMSDAAGVTVVPQLCSLTYVTTHVGHLTYISGVVTMGFMTTMARSFSAMLRNSGDVLHELEHADVLLHRRDGEDVVMVASHREAAVRDSLSMAVRGLGAVLADASLADRALDALAGAMPWTAWLKPDERGTFARAFVATAQACYETDYYEPLSRLLNRWKTSAEIAHDPELAALLAADRGDDELISLDRPAV